MFGKLFGRKKKAPDPTAAPVTPDLAAAPAPSDVPTAQEHTSNRPAPPADMKSLIGIAMAHTQALQKGHVETWGLGQGDRWDVDLQAGTISWTFADKIVRAPAELIGTYSENDGSFLWGWNHPSAPEGSAVAATAVKAHGDAHGLKELQSGKLNCKLDDCWPLSSMAVFIGDLQGVYRGQAGDGVYAFIGFGRVTLEGN